MSVPYYSYSKDKNKKLSDHFTVGEFVSYSDYYGHYPEQIPIESRLITMLEQLHKHFNCGRIDINSGYRTPAIDKSVGGSGSGPHTYGKAVDAYLYDKNGKSIPSKLVACFLQDNNVPGIGLNCGGNPNGTHFDYLDRVWHADETRYNVVSDFYSYTGVKKSDVYPAGSSTANTQVTKTTASVGTVQNWLNSTYKSGLTVDSIYGKQTKSALVKALQTALGGLTVDGIFGAKTKAAVKNLSIGSTGKLVYILQGLLLCNGFTTGGFDGVYGTGTKSAVVSFQYKNGLVTDGIAGRETFARLCM